MQQAAWKASGEPRGMPVALGIAVALVQVSLGICLFAIFQEYVPVELGVGDGWGGYLLAAYGGARFLAETPTGALTDRVERKLALLIGLVVLLVVVTAMSFVQESWLFLAGAALLGFGTAFVWPATYAIAADLYESHRRGKVIGFLNLCQLLGFGLGALVGALLVEKTSTTLFVIAIAACAAAIVVALIAVPSHRTLSLFGRPPLDDTRPSLRDVFTPQIALLSLLVLMATTAVGIIIPAIRPYGDQVLDASFSTVTIALIPGVILGGALYVPAGHAADRFGRTLPLLVGQGLLVLGMMTVAQTTLLGVAAFGGAVIFAGNVFSVPAINAAVMDAAPESHRGTLIGLTVALSGLGLAIGPAVGGVISGSLDPPAAFRVGALLSLVTAVVIVLYGRAYRTFPAHSPTGVAGSEGDAR